MKLGPFIITIVRVGPVGNAARGSIDHYLKRGEYVKAGRYYRAYVRNDFAAMKAYLEHRKSALGLNAPDAGE